MIKPGWSIPILTITNDVMRERARQLKKWGEQHHADDGVDYADKDMAWWKRDEDYWKSVNDSREVHSWLAILMEEIAEAFAEEDPAKKRKELVECAAVIFAWIEDMDSRNTDSPSSPSLTNSNQGTNVLPFPVRDSSTANARSTTTDAQAPRSTSLDSDAMPAA